MLGKKKFHTANWMLTKLLKVWGLGRAWLPNTMAKCNALELLPWSKPRLLSSHEQTDASCTTTVLPLELMSEFKSLELHPTDETQTTSKSLLQGRLGKQVDRVSSCSTAGHTRNIEMVVERHNAHPILFNRKEVESLKKYLQVYIVIRIPLSHPANNL